MHLLPELITKILGELDDVDRFSLRFTAVGRFLGAPRTGEHVLALLRHVMDFKTLAVRFHVAGKVVTVAPRLNKPKRFKVWLTAFTSWQPFATDLTIRQAFETIMEVGQPTRATLRTSPQLPAAVQLATAGHDFATRIF